MSAVFVAKNKNNKKYHLCHFQFVQTGQTSGVVYDDQKKIAEIKNLQLCNVKFRPSGQVIIGETVKMPLFWRQYANHQNSLRNAGVNGELSNISIEMSELNIQVNSTNQDKSILSNYSLKITYCIELESYVFTIKAKLEIPDGKRWKVTYNSAHGELEFCNLWPENCFEQSNNNRKKYDACYVRYEQDIIKIPHHHLETSDKNNISLGKGGCFYWLLEDENLVLEILNEQQISAGICAYMWDAHFGYRVISPENKENTTILTNQTFKAEFKMYAIDRASGKSVLEQAEKRQNPEINNIPIYLDGVNTFSKTLLDFPENVTNLWPWSYDTDSRLNPKDIFKLDREKGFDDHCSLSIQQKVWATSRWLVTTFGLAFGQSDFEDGARYRLTAFIYAEDVEETRIAIRLHRKGIGNIFDIGTYELFYSPQKISGNSDWQKLEVTTPTISPKPDRLHLLLEQKGSGKSWYDNVLFEKI